MALLEVREVTKTFGGVVANDRVSLTVTQGRITGLIGPNGSGKTTLFNSVTGNHAIDAGSIRLNGREISRLGVGEIARRGLVRTFQHTRVYTRMSCLDNMLVSTSRRREALRAMVAPYMPGETQRAEALLEFVGLYPKRRLAAGHLSFGQQKLLEFAMALMNQPRLLLLDEPTAGINPTLVNDLVDRLRRAQAELGITLCVIEHNMRVIVALADHVYCLAQGRVLAEGAPGTIRKDPRVIEAYLGGRA
jgi:branched-chain amino acid transport system ATP-binding protein